MRQTISALVAALAVIAAGAAPARACGFGCAPCGYIGPCGAAYVQPYYAGYAGFERLPDPEVQYHSPLIAPPQYYYVEQGPTFTGPGAFAPYRYYQEQGIYGGGYHYYHRYHHRPHVLHSLY